MNYLSTTYLGIHASKIRIILGIFLLFVCAQISIPLQPVPITFHTVGVMIIALCYNKNEALKAVSYYVGLAAIGFPILTEYYSGILRPTGGYTIGFIAATYIITLLREKNGDKSWLQLVCYGMIGTAIIFLFGIAWLSYFVGIIKAIEVGLLPFILTGFLKVLFTGSLTKLIKGRS